MTRGPYIKSSVANVQNEFIATNRKLTLQVSDLLVERRELHADAGRLRAALVGRLERTSDMSPQDIAELQGEVEKLKTENEGFRERAMEQGAEVERLKAENAMPANDIIQRNVTCARQLLEAGAEIERLTDKVANRDRLLAMADAASWDLLKERERILNAEMERLRALSLEKQAKIEQLRAEAERLTKIAQTACDETFEKQTKINELRSVLQKIADLNDSEADEPLDDAIAIARAALERKPFQAPDTGHTEGQSIATKSEPGSAAAPSIQDEDWQPWPNSYNPNRTR